ncbi:unnamed protein product [Ilex paraguariensis]|uniref:Disease resistance protein RPM1-like n=1 Tax=Ilex paraguariensis TaxID=185542 RepID=A0ABC8SFD3_9AQUA
MVKLAVSFLLDQLKPFLLEEARLLGGVREEFVDIKDELKQMQAFLRVADVRKETDPQLKVWVEQVQDVAFDTEDVLDEFMLQFGHARGDGFQGFLRKIACSIKNLKARHQIASELQKIKSRVDNISKVNSGRYQITEQGSSSTFICTTGNDGRGNALLIEESELVGIEKPKQQLITWVLGGDSRLRVVSVVGMGGSGKTTLVKKVFDDNHVKTQFQSHAWITVSESFNLVELLKKMISQLHDEIRQDPPRRMESMNDNELKVVIKEFLHERRYVVVLDDVWTIEAWEAIKYVFPNNNCKSCLLLTTRMHDVASTSSSDFHGDHIHHMKALSDEESWALFCKKTFNDTCCPRQLEEYSRKILRKCEGLPLAIVVIGGVLASKDKSTIKEWEMINCSLGDELENNDKFERIKKILYLSYNDLPYYLKNCFLYLGIFPEDYEIDISGLIRQWTTLRLVQGRETKTVEEVAMGYFNELLNRSLIQLQWTEPKMIEELADDYFNEVLSGSLIQRLDTKWEGSPRTCHIHDLLREILMPKLREQNIIIVASGQDIRWPDKARGLAIHNLEDVKENKCLRQLRSLAIFGRMDSGRNTSLFSRLIDGCKYLKVLDLSYSWMGTFPDGVCKLLHLRYLSMRATWLRAIPKSIQKLRNLETLDLRYCNVNELPVNIGELRKLRYLLLGWGKIRESRCKAPMNIGNLSSLQKLGTIDADESNGNIIMGEVGKLTQLKTLYITGLRREDGMTLCSSLAKLSKLRSLTVRSVFKGHEFLDLLSLSSCPPFLQKLQLIGQLENVPRWILSLQSLVRLQLGESKLRDDQIQCLQDLPNLLQLELNFACVGESLFFKVGGFQRLKILKLYNLQELRWVRVEQGAMPNLEMLYLRYCPLEKVPVGIEHLTKLQLLDLSYMSDSFIKKLSNRGKEGGIYKKIAHISEIHIKIIKNGAREEFYLQ